MDHAVEKTMKVNRELIAKKVLAAMGKGGKGEG